MNPQEILTSLLAVQKFSGTILSKVLDDFILSYTKSVTYILQTFYRI